METKPETPDRKEPDIDAQIKLEKLKRAFPCFYGPEPKPTSLYNL
jgi:hypothetical protein